MSNFEPIKETVRNAAQALGIEEYELYYTEAGSISAETFRDEISAFTSSVGANLYFRCIVDGKLGYATTQYIDTNEVALLVSRAVENSRVSEKDEKAIIFGGAMSTDYKRIRSYVAKMPAASVIKQIVMSCRNTIYAADPMVSDGTECEVGANENTIRLYNSKGLDLTNHVGNTYAYMYAVLDDGNEKVYDYDFAYNSLDNLDKSALAAMVLERAHAKFGAEKVKTGKYDIVFDTKQASNILSAFISVFYAENAQKGLSLLKGKVGEIIAADNVTITDDPFYPGNTMQISFDGEGVPTRTKTVVENGKLKTLLYNLTSAEKDGISSTGNAARSGSSIDTKPYTFYINPGSMTRKELFEKAGNGIYVTVMKGFHAGANAVTGDFSLESAGFLIENGKVTKPVKSLTIAGNFFELLKNIAAIGCEIDLRCPGYTRIASPDILVPQLSVAGE